MEKKLLIILVLLSAAILFLEANERFYLEAQKYFVQGDYEKAERWFKLSMDNKMVTPEQHYWLGKTYIALQEYDLAYDHLKIYEEKNLGADQYNIDKILEIVENQIEFTKTGNNIYSLGILHGFVNSEYSDFAPVLSDNGNIMYITSQRNADLAKDNIWMLERVGNQWLKPTLITALSSNRNESLGTLTEDGEKAYLFGNYLSDSKMGDLYMSRKTGKSWEKPSLISGVNSAQIEIQPYVYNDEVMFFASNREDCYGELDLYVSEKIGGSWTTPVNLGPMINTPEMEQTPFLDWDGNTLYFASNGHPGLGGLDLFKAERIGESWQDWSEPENLGLVVNSVKDERYFYRSPFDETEAYIVSNRFQGRGHDDIYRVTISEIEEIEVIEEILPMELEPTVDEVTENLAMREVFVIENINFEFDKAELTPESLPILDDLVEKFTEYPDLVVEISGHTDNIGPEAYNLELSKKRAESVVNYLVEQGVPAVNLTSKGFGESIPVASNDTEDGRAMNRRVEMMVPEAEEDTMIAPEIEISEEEEPVEFEIIEESDK